MPFPTISCSKWSIIEYSSFLVAYLLLGLMKTKDNLLLSFDMAEFLVLSQLLFSNSCSVTMFSVVDISTLRHVWNSVATSDDILVMHKINSPQQLDSTISLLRLLRQLRSRVIKIQTLLRPFHWPLPET
jgi:hypothetical protein